MSILSKKSKNQKVFFICLWSENGYYNLTPSPSPTGEGDGKNNEEPFNQSILTFP